MPTFIRNPIPELLTHADATTIIHNRVIRFAEAFELPSQRILDWCFVQAVLSWVWAIEDGCDTDYFERTTRILVDCYDYACKNRLFLYYGINIVFRR